MGGLSLCLIAAGALGWITSPDRVGDHWRLDDIFPLMFVSGIVMGMVWWARLMFGGQ